MKKHRNIPEEAILETNGPTDFRPAYGHRSCQIYDYRLAGRVKIADTVEVPYDYVQYSVSDGTWLSGDELAAIGERRIAQIRSQYADTAKALALGVADRKRSLVAGTALWSAIGISFGIMVISIIRSNKRNAVK